MNFVPFMIRVEVKAPTLLVYVSNKNKVIKPSPIIQTDNTDGIKIILNCLLLCDEKASE